VPEAFHYEVIACLQGLLRAADLGISNVIVETDALMVKEAATTKNGTDVSVMDVSMF